MSSIKDKWKHFINPHYQAILNIKTNIQKFTKFQQFLEAFKLSHYSPCSNIIPSKNSL